MDVLVNALVIGLPLWLLGWWLARRTAEVGAPLAAAGLARAAGGSRAPAAG